MAKPEPWTSISCCAGIHAACVCAGQSKPSCACPCHLDPGSLPVVRPSAAEVDRMVAWLRSLGPTDRENSQATQVISAAMSAANSEQQA